MKMSERERNAVRDLIAAVIVCVVDIGRAIRADARSINATKNADLIVEQIEILGAEEEEQSAAAHRAASKMGSRP